MSSNRITAAPQIGEAHAAVAPPIPEQPTGNADITICEWPEKPILCGSVPFKFYFGDRSDKVFSGQLLVTYIQDASWLCGGNIIKDFCVSVRPDEVFEPELLAVVPKDFGTIVYQSWVAKNTIQWITAKITDALMKIFYEQRTKILDKLFPQIVDMLNAKDRLTLMGGRTTKWEGHSREAQIRSPELAEYIINNKLGIITASHFHVSANHRLGEGSSTGFSGQQYWVWSYQDKGSTPVVLNASKQYCGVFPGPWEGMDEQAIKEHFYKSWGKSHKANIDHPQYEPRYKLNTTAK
jgi:hypothetical protein